MNEPRPEVRNQVHASDVSGVLVQAGHIDAVNMSVNLSPARWQALNGLPPQTAMFTGRADELKILANAPFVVVSGLAGVGKSALALRFAHAGHFPGGCLYVDLQDYDPERRVTPAQALENFLRALGVQDIPPELDQRSTLFRSLVADREPMLILLDNAASTASVQPLLVTGHRTIVTSRHTLAGLDDAHHLELGVLPPGEATALVGDPELAELCGRLPLALRIMAALRKTNPGRDWASELREARLETLDDGDRLPISAQFDLSYRALTSVQQRFFRLAALHPTHEITVEGAALLADIPIPKARKLLRQLRMAHLVEPDDRLHDLVRLYVAGYTREDEDRHAAMDRFVDGLARRAEVMQRNLATPKQFEALHWFDMHRSTLVMTGLGANIAYRAHLAIPLTRALVDYLGVRGPLSDQVLVAELALCSAINAKDRHAEMDARISLAYVHLNAGQDEQAAACFHTVWEQIRTAHDLPLIHRTLTGFKTALERTGRHEAAAGAARDLEMVEQELRRRSYPSKPVTDRHSSP
jgi:hypothetical protein